LNAVAKQTPVEQLPLASTPTENPVMSMIRQAVAAGQPLDVIRELKDMAKELAADEADRAFKAAFANFKGEVITVTRNRQITDGPLKGRKYAELVSFVDAATPALSKHGLSASWSITKDEKDWIEVTCTIEHSLGGKKSVSLGGGPDAGGAKNALQARISTVTYLERVTFKAACGLAEQGDDDDGQSVGKPVSGGNISEAQLVELRRLIDQTETDIAKFCDTFKIEALPMLPAGAYDAATKSMHIKLARKLSEAKDA
jgi:hypothetical protein